MSNIQRCCTAPFWWTYYSDSINPTQHCQTNKIFH